MFTIARPPRTKPISAETKLISRLVMPTSVHDGASQHEHRNGDQRELGRAVVHVERDSDE
jgi:hypothetical protein